MQAPSRLAHPAHFATSSKLVNLLEPDRNWATEMVRTVLLVEDDDMARHDTKILDRTNLKGTLRRTNIPSLSLEKLLLGDRCSLVLRGFSFVVDAITY
jgi:hypothetical protein